MSPNYTGGKEITLCDLAAVVADVNTPGVIVAGYRGFIAFLNADFNSGTSTLDIKLQTKSPEGVWFDIPNADFVQVTTANSDQAMSVGTDLIAVANVSVPAYIGKEVRAFINVGASGSPNYDIRIDLYLVT